ncbi:MAG: FimV/HubP family polar landmark protein, partial [Gammaproteobacteria bacterium]
EVVEVVEVEEAAQTEVAELADPEPVQPLAAPAAPVELQQQPELSDNYETQQGDTLWRIASQSKTDGLTTNQMMLAIYRANPEAFLGNINALKAGAILRLPSAENAGELSVSQAETEAKQQHSDWAGGIDAATESEPVVAETESSSGMQLELVPPTEPVPADTGPGVTDSENSVETTVESFGEDASSADESLLTVEDAEMAALQDRTEADERAAEAEAMLAEELEMDEIGDPVTDSETDVFVDGIDEPLESPFADEAQQLEDDLAAEESTAVTSPLEEPEAQEPVEDLSAQQGIIDLVKSYGLYAGGVLFILVALFLYRRRSSFAEAETATSPAADVDEAAYEDNVSEEQPAEDPFLSGGYEAPDSVQEPEEEPEPDSLSDDLAQTQIREVADDNLTATDAIADFDEPESEPETTIDRKSYEQDGVEGNRAGRTSDYDHTDTVTEQAINEDEMSEFGVPEALGDPETPLEKTISTGAPLNLDQADPMAEADFHMAYGLYDQAADLLVNALIEAPENRDYRVKLIEVYFVWENKDGFLEQAKALRESFGDEGDADWNKVLILGKQLCPDAELFAGGDAVAPSADAMDLEFGEDEGDMDLDLSLGGTEVKALDENAANEVADDTLDFDLGSAIAESDNEAFKLDLSAQTKEEGEEVDPASTMKIDEEDLSISSDAPTMEVPAIEAPTVEADMMMGETMESPTLEMPDPSSLTANMPGLDGFELDDPEPSEASNSADDTGSLDVDLSGLADFDGGSEAEDPKMDIDSTLNQLDNTGELLKPQDVEDFGRTLTEENASDAIKDELANTLGDSDATEIVNPADLPHLKMPDLGDTVEQPDAGGDETAAQPVDESGDTVEQPDADAEVTALLPIDESAEDTALLPVDESAETASQPSLDDLDVTVEVPLGGIIPGDATMTEVGTKLDLARAYIDMGDPDGARSILNEVIEEGGEPQQQAARKLLEELGG